VICNTYAETTSGVTMSDLRHRSLRSATPLRDRGVSVVAVRKRPSMACHGLHLGPALGSPSGVADRSLQHQFH